MLLGKKPKYAVASEWAVILNRSENEFSRNRAVDKLTELFSLSLEEAKDLIDNTPIILLDQLSLELAEKIKDQISQARVDCSLTNDTFAKRKCFRAIWPEPPDISHFLRESSSSPAGNFKEPSRENVERSLSPERTTAEAVPVESYVNAPQNEQRQLQELTLDLQKENEMLRLELEKAEDSIKGRTDRQFNPEIEKLQNERLQLEEAMRRLRNENAALLSKAEGLEQNLKTLRQTDSDSVLTANSQLTELKTQVEHFRNECQRAQVAIRFAQNGAKQYQAECARAQKECSEARAEAEELKRVLGQAQEASAPLKEMLERGRLEMERRLQTQAAEVDEWKRKANDWNASYFKVIKENEFLRAHQSEELEGLRVRNRELTEQLERAQKQIRDFVGQLEHQDLIQKRMKAGAELAEHEAQLKAWVQRQQTLEEEIHLREEEMKKVLAEQEVVEREIVKAKQAQKYLIEQAKIKEKGRLSRQKGPSQNVSSPQDLDSIPPSAD